MRQTVTYFVRKYGASSLKVRRYFSIYLSTNNICFILYKRSTRGKLILSEMKNSGTVTHPCICAFNLFHPSNQICLGCDGSSAKKIKEMHRLRKISSAVFQFTNIKLKLTYHQFRQKKKTKRVKYCYCCGSQRFTGGNLEGAGEFFHTVLTL